jgi:hypothetical protein
MSRKVISTRAVGKSGKVAGKMFVAVSRNGKYTLHSKHLSTKTGKPLRFAVNKVLVDSLQEAADLLNKGRYYIRLYNAEHKQSNLRSSKEVEVVFA